MKKLVTILAVVLLNASLFAQSPPQKMSYQAIIRNSSNALVTSTTVGMQITILQASPMGGTTPVYVETQTPTTNVNGLVSIEVGAGTVISGTFSTISWANGPFYIKTETDPAGGTNYSITGTSQLLSVPYAFFAKTAGTITGTITETDPIFGASAANGITTSNISDWNNKQNVLTAGSGISISGTTISTLANAHHINESYGGGIVFYVYDNGQHGLIASPVDQGLIQWYNGQSRATGSTGDGLGAGAMNTAMIVATQMTDNYTGNFAAKVCADYSVTVNGITYGDWYLPSKYELELLYLEWPFIPGIHSTSAYQSSTEDTKDNYWGVNFSNNTYFSNLKNISAFVRAIRSF
jgi:hypothetical protein